MVDYDKIGRLIMEYYNLDDSRESSTKRVSLESHLRDVCLTGEEIVKKGVLDRVMMSYDQILTNYYEAKNDLESKSADYELLKTEIEEIKTNADNLEKESLQSQIELEEATSKIDKLKHFLQGKRGALIEDILNMLS